MVAWENKPILIKDNYNKAKQYFKTLVKDFETYMQKVVEQPAKKATKV
jgi:hypothetical protein